MSHFSDYKPGVPKRYLLFVSACVWTLAGMLLWLRGTAMVVQDDFPLHWSIANAILWGILFYLLIFAQISFKYSKRIFRINIEKPCVFSFFSIKGYIMMIVMISAGIFLRRSGSVNLVIIGQFYMIMGMPLILSSFRFWYYGIRYKHFMDKFRALAGAKIPALPRWQRWLRNILSFGLMIGVIVVILTNWRISSFAQPYIYASIDELPYNKVGVVPGTSSKIASGYSNLYFHYRLQAAAKLYKAGKIKYIIVSGDNRTVKYNEPQLMREELIKLGVPDSCIIPDYAGRRTFDSVIRAWKIFGQKNFTFISQHFQNERAVFIARHNGIETIAFNARDVGSFNGFKTKVRELFARVKVFIDVYILHTQPQIMGDPEPIKD